MSSSAQFPDEQSWEGEFRRQEDVFREWVTADGSSGYQAECGRYHLYVSWACPWAHLVIIARQLKGLETVISMSALDPIRDNRGWAFRDGDGYSSDPINGFEFLSHAYRVTDSGYDSRVTVPVLWDRVSNRIVSNSDDDIMRMFDREFGQFSNHPMILYPENLSNEIDALNDTIYVNVNDGVYRAGFATSQSVYESAVNQLFQTLDILEDRLATQRYLFGAHIVETDWRLFVTLIRFDSVYYGHFKCNIRRIIDYPNLFGYLKDLYQVGGIAETVRFDHIKRHYYMTHGDINPTRIVPVGPCQDLHAAHGRDLLG
tara:strand:- start:10250 stop:11194 length:945 start_codon:yes stop_codon:yes gene_type:complete